MSDLSFRDELRRKTVHLSSFWMPVVISIFPGERVWLALFFGLLTAGSVLVEHAYARKHPAIRKAYDFFFGGMLRKEPSPDAWVISGGPPVLAASCISLVLFPSVLAASVMALMLGGDTAAALIGRRFGRIRFPNGKSLEGSTAFFLAGGLAFALFFSFGGYAPHLVAVSAAIAALAGTFAELFTKELHVDDNFGIPVLAGIAVETLLFFL